MTNIPAKPMLVRDGDWSTLDALIDDPNIAFQRKHDGHRRPVTITGSGTNATIVGLNRDGEPSTLPPQIVKDFNGIGFASFDCELTMDDGPKRLLVFDLVRFGDVVTPDMPLSARLAALEWLFKAHQFGPAVELVPTARTAEEKRALIDQIEADGGEGWVAKPLGIGENAKSTNPSLNGKYRYVAKGRTPWLRFKRRADIDCVVMARGREKDHLVLGLYWKGDLQPVGTVTALAGDGPRAKAGDVVNVKLMGVAPSGRLREPTLPKIRTDKAAAECGMEQMDAVRLNTRRSVHVF